MNRADYADNGVILNTTTKMIDGVLYGFDGNGAMLNDGIGRVSGGIVYARSNGKLVTDRWYQNEKGWWYYFDENGLSYGGKRTIRGTDYLFEPGLYIEEAGTMVTSGAFAIDGVNYAANDKGRK